MSYKGTQDVAVLQDVGLTEDLQKAVTVVTDTPLSSDGKFVGRSSV